MAKSLLHAMSDMWQPFIRLHSLCLGSVRASASQVSRGSGGFIMLRALGWRKEVFREMLPRYPQMLPRCSPAASQILLAFLSEAPGPLPCQARLPPITPQVSPDVSQKVLAVPLDVSDVSDLGKWAACAMEWFVKMPYV